MSAYSLTIFILSITLFAFAPFIVVFFSFSRIMNTVRGRRHRVCPSIISNQLRVAIDLYARSAYTSLLLIVTSLVFVFPACFTMAVDGLQIVYVDPDFETALKWLMWLHCVVKPLIYATKQSFVGRKYKFCPIFFALTRSMLPKTLIKNSFYKHRFTHFITTPSTPKITTASCTSSNGSLYNKTTVGNEIPSHSKKHFDAQITNKIKTTKHVGIKKAWSLDADVGFSDIYVDVECSASSNGANVMRK